MLLLLFLLRLHTSWNHIRKPLYTMRCCSKFLMVAFFFFAGVICFLTLAVVMRGAIPKKCNIDFEQCAPLFSSVWRTARPWFWIHVVIHWNRKCKFGKIFKKHVFDQDTLVDSKTMLSRSTWNCIFVKHTRMKADIFGHFCETQDLYIFWVFA